MNKGLSLVLVFVRSSVVLVGSTNNTKNNNYNNRRHEKASLAIQKKRRAVKKNMEKQRSILTCTLCICALLWTQAWSPSFLRPYFFLLLSRNEKTKMVSKRERGPTIKKRRSHDNSSRSIYYSLFSLFFCIVNNINELLMSIKSVASRRTLFFYWVPLLGRKTAVNHTSPFPPVLLVFTSFRPAAWNALPPAAPSLVSFLPLLRGLLRPICHHSSASSLFLFLGLPLQLSNERRLTTDRADGRKRRWSACLFEFKKF